MIVLVGDTDIVAMNFKDLLTLEVLVGSLFHRMRYIEGLMKGDCIDIKFTYDHLNYCEISLFLGKKGKRKETEIDRPFNSFQPDGISSRNWAMLVVARMETQMNTSTMWERGFVVEYADHKTATLTTERC